MIMNLDVETATYLLRVAQGAQDGTLPFDQLPEGCRECEEAIEDMMPGERAYHVIAKQEHTEFVVIGCEGYWHFNPALVLMEKPGWQDWYVPEPESVNPALDLFIAKREDAARER